MSGALVFVVGSREALWLPGSASQWDSPVLQRCNKRRNRSRLATTHPQRAAQRQQSGTHAKSFCEKGLFACLGASVQGTGFWCGAHLGAYGTLWGWRPVVATHAPYLSLAPNCGCLWKSSVCTHLREAHPFTAWLRGPGGLCLQVQRDSSKETVLYLAITPGVSAEGVDRNPHLPVFSRKRYIYILRAAAWGSGSQSA